VRRATPRKNRRPKIRGGSAQSHAEHHRVGALGIVTIKLFDGAFDLVRYGASPLAGPFVRAFMLRSATG
jgi:hypothetical protein